MLYIMTSSNIAEPVTILAARNVGGERAGKHYAKGNL
ncbi:MAG: hypothetical protein JWQ04_1677 [Pedosphaera sp.]|nr:hypothetical protein [Pedosphaera sp.]